MRRDLFAKLALGCAGIVICGSLAGLGLANYATSGSFEFYKHRRVAQWQAELPPRPTALESTDLAFASDRPAEPGGVATDGRFASLDP